MVSKNFNIDYTSSLQFTATVPVSIGKWYNANYVLTCYKDRYKSSDWYGYSFDRSKWATMLNLSNTFTTPTFTFPGQRTMNGMRIPPS